MNKYFKYLVIILLYSLLLNNCSSLLSEKEFVDKLLYLVEQNSSYTSVSGDNLLLWKDGKFHCDSSGMIKAILNGFDIYNVKEGDKLSGFDITGDKNSTQLIDSCTDISTNFDFKNSGPRLVYFPGHIGVYLGKEVQCGEKEDEVCNVVECTSSWNGGIQLSYVNYFGKRFNKKNGKADSYWKKSGVPSLWVQYNCKNIIPNEAGNCVLSPEDKNSYKYCCFEEDVLSFYHDYKCVPYNKTSYMDKLFEVSLFEGTEFEEVFECNLQEEKPEISPESTDCEANEPKTFSDCLLSKEDQKYFKYCCFEGIEGIEVSCGAYTQDSYEIELYYYETFKELPNLVFKCNTEIKEIKEIKENKEIKEESGGNTKSSSKYISIGLLLFSSFLY